MDRQTPIVLANHPALDGIRAIAVLAVLTYHTGFAIGRGGFLGVDIFFVLSGFLITAVLLRDNDETGQISLRDFYRRRALRLFPALGAVVFVSVLAAATLTERSQLDATARAVPFAVFYSANWARVAHIPLGLLEHTWSLSIEEQFYLLWPAGLVVLRRRLRPRALAALLLVAATTAAAVDLVRWLLHSSPQAIYNGLESHGAPLLLVGCAAGVAYTAGLFSGEAAQQLGRRVCWPAMAAIAIAMLATTDHSSVYYAGGMIPVALACAAVIVGVVIAEGLPRRMLSWSPLVALGRISYGVYLWHWPVYIVVREHLAGRPGSIVYPIEIGVSVTVATVSYRAVERPFLLRKARHRTVADAP